MKPSFLQKGYVVVWGADNNPIHAGIVLQDNPYKVLHRNGKNGMPTLSDLNEMNHEFNSAGIQTRYKVPSKLELIGP